MTRGSHFPFRVPVGAALAIAVLAVLLCAPAQAGRSGHRHARPRPVSATAAKTVPAPSLQPSTGPSPAVGMVVGIDPETGALGMPSPEQMLQLTPQERTGLLRTGEGLSEVRLANGAVMVDLQGQFMEYSLIRLDPMGRPSFSCVNDETVLRRLLASRAPACSAALEEK
jgi:hypothetical protein